MLIHDCQIANKGCLYRTKIGSDENRSCMDQDTYYLLPTMGSDYEMGQHTPLDSGAYSYVRRTWMDLYTPADQRGRRRIIRLCGGSWLGSGWSARIN
jgi:hypothetical protein